MLLFRRKVNDTHLGGDHHGLETSSGNKSDKESMKLR